MRRMARAVALSATIMSFVTLLTSVAPAQTALAQASQGDPRVADLVRAGELRFGLGLGVLTQAVKIRPLASCAVRRWSLGEPLQRESGSDLSSSNIQGRVRCLMAYAPMRGTSRSSASIRTALSRSIFHTPYSKAT